MTAVNEAKPRRSRELLHRSRNVDPPPLPRSPPWLSRSWWEGSKTAPSLPAHGSLGVGAGPRVSRDRPAGRAPSAASSARRLFGDIADTASSLLGVSSRVPAKSGGSLPAAEGRSGARKGGTGPCRGKGSAERGPCIPRRGRRSEPPARGWAGEALAGVLGDCRALTARLLGRFGAFHPGHGRRGDQQVPSGLRAFDLGIFRVSHRHVASKPAGLKKRLQSNVLFPLRRGAEPVRRRGLERAAPEVARSRA